MRDYSGRGTRIDGVNRLRDALASLNATLDDPRQVQITAKEVQNRTKRRVDVVTGAQKRYTKITPPKKGIKHKGISVSVGWNQPKSLRAYVWMEEYGTSKRPANSALTSAVEDVASKHHKRIAKQIMDSVK